MKKVKSIVKAKESGNEEVWSARLIGKVDCVKISY